MAWLVRNFIQSEVRIHATCNNVICYQTGLNMDGKTCNIAFQHVLQQCCKTSCMFLLPILPVALRIIFCLFWSFILLVFIYSRKVDSCFMVKTPHALFHFLILLFVLAFIAARLCIRYFRHVNHTSIKMKGVTCHCVAWQNNLQFTTPPDVRTDGR